MIYHPLAIGVNIDGPLLLIRNYFERPKVDVVLQLGVIKLLADHSFGIVEAAIRHLFRSFFGRLTYQSYIVIFLNCDH